MGKAILILGMHRSGTSALAGTLHLAGIDLGPDLMVGKGDNPKGFFEHNGVWETHQKLLTALSSDWDDTRSLPEGWESSEAAAAATAALSKIVRRDFLDSAAWSVKDPRISRLFPIWPTVVATAGAALHVVLALRHPVEVASSLTRRNGMKVTHGLALWLRHTLEAERATRVWPRAIQHYPNLLADWRIELSRLREALQLDLPARTKEQNAKIDVFLDGSLRHNQATGVLFEAEKSGPVAAWCAETYDAMRELPGISAQRKLDVIYNDYQTWEWNAAVLDGAQWKNPSKALVSRDGRHGDAGPLRGYVDRIDWSGATGWAFNSNESDQPVALEILDNDRPIRYLIADRFREDLAKAGVGNGRHGFDIAFTPPLSQRVRHVLRVRRQSDKRELPQSGMVLDPVKGQAGPEIIRFFIDEPKVCDGTAELGPGGGLVIKGWAIGIAGIDEVEIFLDGQPAGTARRGLPRNDLEDVFPDFPDAREGGFILSASERPTDGMHKVQVLIRDKLGRERTGEFSLQVPSIAQHPDN